MRKILSRLILLAVLLSGIWLYAASSWQENSASIRPDTHNSNAKNDNSLPLDWPPRAEDGRSESFFSALALYFKTLFSADEILQDAHDVAAKSEQRQQEIDRAVENKQ